MSILARRNARALTIAAAIALAIPLALGGCSFSASTGPATISGADFSKQVADQFEKQLNVRPVVDCGSDTIQVVEGATVHCDFSASDDPGTHYDSTTTISNVNGADFHIVTKVADQPK
jgi:hypothetical protein